MPYMLLIVEPVGQRCLPAAVSQAPAGGAGLQRVRVEQHAGACQVFVVARQAGLQRRFGPGAGLAGRTPLHDDHVPHRALLAGSGEARHRAGF